MKKKIILISIAVLIVMTITSCSKPNTAKGFQRYIENETDFVITDEITSLFPDDAQEDLGNLSNESLVKGYTVKKKSEKNNENTKITYYELKSEKEARYLYEYLESIDILYSDELEEMELSSLKDKNVIESSDKEQSLIIISRVGKGVIFASADKANKAEVEKLVKGYGF